MLIAMRSQSLPGITPSFGGLSNFLPSGWWELGAYKAFP